MPEYWERDQSKAEELRGFCDTGNGRRTFNEANARNPSIRVSELARLVCNAGQSYVHAHCELAFVGLLNMLDRQPAHAVMSAARPLCRHTPGAQPTR